MEGPDNDERRFEERSPCALPATIVLAGGREPLACIVRDLSETGARIEIADPTRLPDEFELLLPAVPGADQRFRVKVRWRDHNMVGAEFLRIG